MRRPCCVVVVCCVLMCLWIERSYPPAPVYIPCPSPIIDQLPLLYSSSLTNPTHQHLSHI